MPDLRLISEAKQGLPGSTWMGETWKDVAQVRYSLVLPREGGDLEHDLHHTFVPSWTQGGQHFMACIHPHWLWLLCQHLSGVSQRRALVLSSWPSKLIIAEWWVYQDTKGIWTGMRVSPAKADGRKEKPIRGWWGHPVWQKQEEAIIPSPRETTRGGNITRAHNTGHSVRPIHGRHWPEGAGSTGRGAAWNKLELWKRCC